MGGKYGQADKKEQRDRKEFLSYQNAINYRYWTIETTTEYSAAINTWKNVWTSEKERVHDDLLRHIVWAKEPGNYRV